MVCYLRAEAIHKTSTSNLIIRLEDVRNSLYRLVGVTQGVLFDNIVYSNYRPVLAAVERLLVQLDRKAILAIIIITKHTSHDKAEENQCRFPKVSFEEPRRRVSI